jgi:hypothetical protein
LRPDLAVEVASIYSLSEWDETVLCNWARLGELNGTFDLELGHAMFELAGLANIAFTELGPQGVAAAIVANSPRTKDV